MWHFALTILASGLLFFADAPRSDLDLFQGTWRIARERRNLENSDRTNEPSLMIFEGNSLTWKTKDAEAKTTFKIDTTTTPKAFDLQGKLFNFPVTLLGYYMFKGDALLIRISDRGKRPSRFPSPQLETGETEYVLIREKAAK
ncbi:TIGR03067 domain-containing protein [Singulisphaera sp. Ch08]|uniref:TIGR03067 domain-containing protein n=1 Tax=Singulisphaera sp. Ch08 TaxID=3120278 RepID=A0AAU7C864_9BACT